MTKNETARPDPRSEAALLSGALAAHARRLQRRAPRRRFEPIRPIAVATPAAPPAALPRELAPEPGSPAALAAAAGSLQELASGVANCTACTLCQTRKQTVFADGTGQARVLFVGEAPGAEEDRTGTPFVGPAGQLLTDIITKGMKLQREDVAIVNVLKCRPPENRDPSAAEKVACTPWLERQIELFDPLVIIPLGRHASNFILGSEGEAMGRMRGKVHERKGRKVVPTYHPAYLLRSPGEKKACWADIKLALAELG